MEYSFHPTQGSIVLNQLHFIVPFERVSFYYSYLKNDVHKGIKKALKKFGFTSAILSKIYMVKTNCITMEKYEEMYKTNEESDDRKDLSVGEDLETFIENIKNGKMNKAVIPEDGDFQETFLLCLIDKEERKKLEQKDYDFMKTFSWNSTVSAGRGEADVPETELEASESNMKFARSYCYRWTYFIEA